MAIILEKPKPKRRQKNNSNKMEKRFMNVRTVAKRRRAFIVNRGFLPLPPGVDPSVVPPPAQVIMDGKTDEQRAENPTLDNSNLPTDCEGHRRARYRMSRAEMEERLRLRDTRWANRMNGIKKIFSRPLRFVAKLIFPPPPLPALQPYPRILPLPRVVPPPVEEVALQNHAHEQVDVPQVEHQHQLTSTDQGPSQQSFVEQASVVQNVPVEQSFVGQSFVHQPPVEQTYDNQSFVALVEQPNQYQQHSEQVYYQPNPNVGYEADMEDMDEDGPSQSYAGQAQAQQQAAFEQQQRAAFEQQQQQQAAFEQQQQAAYEQQQQAAYEQQQRYALEAQAQAAMAYQAQAQAYAQNQAPPPYSEELNNGYPNAYNQSQQPQQLFYPGATSAPAQPAWNEAGFINTAPLQEYHQPAPLQSQSVAQPPLKEVSPPSAPTPAEPSSPIYTPEQRRAWREKMQKIWADEPPKSKPWVLSTSTSSISLPSQELGRYSKSSGVKTLKTVSSEREIKPLPPRTRVQSAPNAQGSGSSRQGSVSSKQGSVASAPKKGTWRLPEPESSFEILGAVVPDATVKKQKKRPIEDADAVDTTTKKQKKKRSVEDGEHDTKEKKQKKRRRAAETVVESTSSKKRIAEPASKAVPSRLEETSSSLKLTSSSMKPLPTTSKLVPQTSKEIYSSLKLTPFSMKPVPSSMKPVLSSMKPVPSSSKPTPSICSSTSKKRKEAPIIIVESDADPEIDESMVRKSKRSKTSPQMEEPVATRRRKKMPAPTKVLVPVEELEGREGKWEIPVVGGLLRAFGLRR